MPRINSTTPASMHVIDSQSSDSLVATIRKGETRLSDVARRLGADQDALLQANPHLSSSTRLKAGQEILLAQGQASPAVVDQLPAKSGLSPAMGDPLASSAMKANLNTKIDAAEPIHSTGGLQTLSSRFNDLHKAMVASLGSFQAVSDQVESVKNDLDSMGEMENTLSLRLQMKMDLLSKLTSTLSNLLKKMSDTSDSITQNLK